MSTSVDNEKRAPRLTAAESRARILLAARAAFTRAGYDAVGVREIAALAGVDPAMVPRLFGSKEALFTMIADEAFRLEPPFDGSIDGMGRRVAHHLMGPIARCDPDDFDEFTFLLRSVGSPTAAPILSVALHTTFIRPLSQRMDGPAAEARAALATAYVMGFAVLRAGLGSPSIEAAGQDVIIERLGDAIQACLTP
ncbi:MULTISPECIES: TetR/AcrR family transcriptional regulator [unclassified Rhizobium]|jgi:AcrR family transcriptional regulator|uniref:TetR/AcrR family transcriptional regulator n=1 Tax=unclassified Rhizobium TaxID=2613769 RepID=UPI0009DF45FC|nr:MULTISPECIES: TetR/AcrR family transcriptional regulator [unclassified Rhizobium]MBN8953140.1 TetR family transcriptional regulator [Rhizobium tropici]RKD75045.1 TetR family transcriptional regulator [Rhizobium sp. WW_1]